MKQLLVTLIVLVAINYGNQFYFKRFDLTHDKRYTLYRNFYEHHRANR